jgi:hypothetical protein
MLDKLKKMIREIHSEPNGSLSWGRCASTGAFLTSAVAVLVSVIHGRSPDWVGAGSFAIAPYTAGRIATAVQSFSGNPVTPNPNQGQSNGGK